MSGVENNKTPSKPLSAKAIEAMKPGSPIRPDIGENEGLRVKCGTTGLKTFSYRYKSPETGKLVQVKIGNFPGVSLAEARVELAKLKGLRRSGVCPKAERDREKRAELERQQQVQQKEQEQSFTVKALIDQYLTGYIEDRYVGKGGKRRKITGARKPKGQAEVRRTLYGDAVRVLGELPAKKVTRKVVVNMVMEVVQRGANVQAGNVLRELSAAYEYAIGLDFFDDEFANPALLAKASLNQAKVKMTHTKGKRVLSDAELKRVLSWLPGSGFSEKQKQILMLTLYTGCRTGEWCEAQWRDVDLKKGFFHIRESKNEAQRYVQLSSPAIELLQGIEGQSEGFIFPSNLKGKSIQQKSLTEIKWQLKNADKLPNRRKFTAEQRWLTDIDDWSPHDLRRTVRSGLSRLGCPSEIGEAVLGHSKKGIVGTYDLHAYEKECKEWLQKWADHLDCFIAS
jgi:integrase